MVNLGVVLVLAASAAVLSLHTAFFQIALLLRHKATMLTVESILEFKEAGIVLCSEVHTHELALYVGVDIVALDAKSILFREFESFTHLLIVVLAQVGRAWPCDCKTRVVL